MDLAIDQTGLGNRWSLAAGLAGWGLSPVTDVAASVELLRVRRSGRIVTQAGRLQAVYGRWWPYTGNLLQAKWDALLRPVASDRCELFYHQAGAEGGFLTLSYVRSGKGTSPTTCYAASLVLDEIARLKQTSAMVCHVTNAYQPSLARAAGAGKPTVCIGGGDTISNAFTETTPASPRSGASD
ncbi:MAG: hypothetical protein R3C56_24620 [Pirellulaceae bacterium]